jgi:hypothetical protein
VFLRAQAVLKGILHENEYKLTGHPQNTGRKVCADPKRKFFVPHLLDLALIAAKKPNSSSRGIIIFLTIQ